MEDDPIHQLESIRREIERLKDADPLPPLSQIVDLEAQLKVAVDLLRQNSPGTVESWALSHVQACQEILATELQNPTALSQVRAESLSGVLAQVQLIATGQGHSFSVDTNALPNYNQVFDHLTHQA